MKRACLLLLPAILLLVLATSACNDESKPIFTRVRVTPACGVAPLEVETYAAVSGGNESGDPMGGTNNLEVTWDFGDGGTGNTSINYHRFLEAGDYTITVTATDPDGNVATSNVPVTVIPDSLEISVSSTPAAGTVAAGEPIQFAISAHNCDVDYPEEPGDAVKMQFRWAMGDADVNENGRETILNDAAPEFAFAVPGDYEVRVSVTYPEQAVTRRETLLFTVVGP